MARVCRPGKVRTQRHIPGACWSTTSWAWVGPLPPWLPTPTLHSSTSAVPAAWGGPSQIRRNNGLGRGQVWLAAEPKRGLNPTHTRTENAIANASCAATGLSFPVWGLRRAQSSFFSSLDFALSPGILVSSLQLAWSSWETGSGVCFIQSSAGQGHARHLPATNFPHLRYTGRSLES